jgi:nitrogen fixation NifU-like protein
MLRLGRLTDNTIVLATSPAPRKGGCAISVARASLLAELAKGSTGVATEAWFHKVHWFPTGEEEAGDEADLGDLAALAGVRPFPMRVEHATLRWHDLSSALQVETTDQVTTE